MLSFTEKYFAVIYTHPILNKAFLEVHVKKGRVTFEIVPSTAEFISTFLS